MSKLIQAMVLLCLILVGCAWQGREIDIASINKIENGVTTEAEIVREFGKPTFVSPKPDNGEKLGYIYTVSRVTGYGVACPALFLNACAPEKSAVAKSQVLEICLDSSTRLVKRHMFRVQ
ncbi:hypothetical protein NBZ79_09320 [Sneathiella marina]|uniref:Lipoprotein SmpA/OmlA domain-containing protein n=1 Tax=Sneathiella marina TaxID=2950108 RepID=A0ABY4WBM3_9PROT|nr:hypothetical protein [Sneathiella marina]USG63175.1 hypothetical protein NBZ79_09320 [Sneathiella marina]